jgi:hypothetical protein
MPRGIAELRHPTLRREFLTIQVLSTSYFIRTLYFWCVNINMATTPLNFFVETDNSYQISRPATVHSSVQSLPKTPPSSPLPPHLLALPQASSSASSSARNGGVGSNPQTSNDMESFAVHESLQNGFGAAELAPTVWEPHKNRFRFIAACLTALCGGLVDSAPGALLPYIERYVLPKIQSVSADTIFQGTIPLIMLLCRPFL